MARYVIDAPTLLHLVDSGQHGWDSLRDAEYIAVARLQADALVTVDPSLAAAARDTVPVAAIGDLLSPG